ncbi:bifunctional 6-phosphofructo-2-kinase/fructose-2,6-bisphosphate 2-phosphatase [Xylona heveae TC161]|uniref:Bifunctional 6-phosphofructo-2-kinase/fructose-2,6-bisphosphate 2-phosphatase n=1 Tax=Xylona heveae (strain CBS 132557 / TC161) TaxID=1328760 RepID=A0A165FA58_XYLHT|nr:bifunctional 6-phosphofructo-2-kinase/fructose-2,6-bisphosphate 2-phosphatase [Xylona heveae TC161]KZF20756.1 bifunctional 6-phosphofructo-2-kinase/fructose-2,6-bisphosphate 2-phosphatase [Xylona heveae TC161]
MPLLTQQQQQQQQHRTSTSSTLTPRYPASRRQSQHSPIARAVIMSNVEKSHSTSDGQHSPEHLDLRDDGAQQQTQHDEHHPHQQPLKTVVTRALDESPHHSHHHSRRPSPPHINEPSHTPEYYHLSQHGIGHPLSDTPAPTAPSSPRMGPRGQHGQQPPPIMRSRPTTLDIPGLTKSKVSPDGKIAREDLGAKMVIVMVGLPARGKSYITKKLARYLNWLQHDTKIFNVGERRREAAGGPGQRASRSGLAPGESPLDLLRRSSIGSQLLAAHGGKEENAQLAAKILINGSSAVGDEEERHEDANASEQLPPDAGGAKQRMTSLIIPGAGRRKFSNIDPDAMEQSAEFFDPNNLKAAQLREQVAMSTLDECLDFLLEQGGAVGVLDATNSTLERRQNVMKRVRERAGPDLGVLFLESLCVDKNLLEANMRLKLSGPDYREQDPVIALEDFKKRVSIYEKSYVPLGEYEEKHDLEFIQMIDVGRKVVAHRIKGFLAAQCVYYLLNFNLSPRQIWITRHGESIDNVEGKIGGDSNLSEDGVKYAKALARFISFKREEWSLKQAEKIQSKHDPPRWGDVTPPNPEYQRAVYGEDPDKVPNKSFCVWTSMLKRSIQTAQYFDEDDFDIKQMKMLDELNAGAMEGMTYEQIRGQEPHEYEARKGDKLQYRYPGPGGEGYLDVINRLRAVIVEIERMTDHVLLIGHRSVARVLLAYFKGLKREEVANLDVPLGTLYMLEPKPYGVDFQAYRYNHDTDWFDYMPNYKLQRASNHSSN